MIKLEDYLTEDEVKEIVQSSTSTSNEFIIFDVINSKQVVRSIKLEKDYGYKAPQIVFETLFYLDRNNPSKLENYIHDNYTSESSKRLETYILSESVGLRHLSRSIGSFNVNFSNVRIKNILPEFKATLDKLYALENGDNYYSSVPTNLLYILCTDKYDKFLDYCVKSKLISFSNIIGFLNRYNRKNSCTDNLDKFMNAIMGGLKKNYFERLNPKTNSNNIWRYQNPNNILQLIRVSNKYSKEQVSLDTYLSYITAIKKDKLDKDEFPEDFDKAIREIESLTEDKEYSKYLKKLNFKTDPIKLGKSELYVKVIENGTTANRIINSISKSKDVLFPYSNIYVHCWNPHLAFEIYGKYRGEEVREFALYDGGSISWCAQSSGNRSGIGHQYIIRKLNKIIKEGIKNE